MKRQPGIVLRLNARSTLFELREHLPECLLTDPHPTIGRNLMRRCDEAAHFLPAHSEPPLRMRGGTQKVSPCLDRPRAEAITGMRHAVTSRRGQETVLRSSVMCLFKNPPRRPIFRHSVWSLGGHMGTRLVPGVR